MDDRERERARLAELRRRFLRLDWRNFVRPDIERFFRPFTAEEKRRGLNHPLVLLGWGT
jgi:hypothetical protein